METVHTLIKRVLRVWCANISDETLGFTNELKEVQKPHCSIAAKFYFIVVAGNNLDKQS